MVSFVLSFLPRAVLDEILTLTESVSEGFPTYLYIMFLWFLLPDIVRVTHEISVAETAKYGPCSFFWVYSLILENPSNIFIYIGMASFS